MKKYEILRAMGWTPVQIAALLDRGIPQHAKDQCFLHRFCPELRPEIEGRLKAGHSTIREWEKLASLDPVLPFTKVHDFVLDQILPLLGTTVAIIDSMCQLEMRADSINHHPWTQTAYARALSFAASLEDWIYLWHFSHEKEVSRRAEAKIREMCSTKEDWVHFLEKADELEAFERELYEFAERLVGREMEDSDPGLSLNTHAARSTSDPALDYLRTVTASLHGEITGDPQQLFQELLRQVQILQSDDSCGPERASATGWIMDCPLPFSAFLTVARQLPIATKPEEKIWQYVSRDAECGANDAVVKRLIETAQTLRECHAAIKYAPDSARLARKFTALATSIEDWLFIWKLGLQTHNAELQDLAFVNALQYATES